MKEKELYINIYSLVSIYAPDMPTQISRHLSNHLRIFTTTTSHREKKESDIVFLKLRDLPLLSLAGSHMNTIYDCWVTEYEGSQAIVFNYKGKPDIVIVVSDNIKIFYSARPKIHQKLYGLLLFCLNVILNKQNGQLFHGALVKKENESLLLTGHRGTKKTLLLLLLLKDRWDYLSEDKMILHNGNAYLFQDFILLRYYHYKLLPWISEMLTDKKYLIQWPGIRSRVRSFTQRHVNKSFHPFFEKYGNPYRKIDVAALFPECRVIHTTKPTKVFVLCTGSAFGIHRVLKTDIIYEITMIQKVLHHKFSLLENLLLFYHQNLKSDLYEIIWKNFETQDIHNFYKITIPADCDIQNIYRELKETVLS